MVRLAGVSVAVWDFQPGEGRAEVEAAVGGPAGQACPQERPRFSRVGVFRGVNRILQPVRAESRVK